MSRPSALRRSLLTRAGELDIQGRHRMNVSVLAEKIREKEAENAEPKKAVLRCSACGSDAEHHVEYVAVHGLCVI